MKKILLIEPDKDLAEPFVGWLEGEDVGVELTDNPDNVPNLLSKKQFDMLLIDIDSPGTTETLLELCKALKKDTRYSDVPITVLTFKKEAGKIAAAIESGADSFILKPFETSYLIDRLGTLFVQYKLKKKGRKALDLNFINYLIELAGGSSREDFFLLSQIILNKFIMEDVKAIFGDPTIVVMVKRVHELVGNDYVFMKAVKFSKGRFYMDGVDNVSKEVPVKELATAFRDYIYAFLQLVQTLTSDILMERGKFQNVT